MGYYTPQGKIIKTGRKVHAVRVGARALYQDESGQLCANINNNWYRFPEEIEY